MKKIFVTALLLLAVLMLAPNEAKAATIERSGNCGGSVTYTLDSDGLLTITGTGAIWDEPAWYDREWEDEIVKVVIQSGVTSIPEYCFADSENMTSISLPNTLTSIGKSAFYYCISLKSIAIPSGVTNIQSSTFQNCTALTTVSLPANLTIIGNYAFDNSGINSITIPASVTEIGDYVFRGCASLTRISVNSANANYSSDSYGVLFNKQKTELLAAPGAMKTYTVPSTVTKICDSAFANSGSLTSVTIPGNVKEIGNTAFENCVNLTAATLSSGVTTIGYRAFNGCTSLSNLSIPDGLTSVGVNAFYNTAYYNSQPDGLIYFGTLLYGVKGTVPASVTIKSGTKVIADNAFSNNSTLTSVSLPEGLERIGTAAFSYCSQLQSITIPSTVEYFGERIFSGCSKMTSAWIKSGVTTIGDEMFYRCTKLTDLSLPDSITHIGELAFSNTGLTSFHVPAGLKSIGKDAFYYVSEAINVYVNNLTTWFQLDFASETSNPLGMYSKFYVNGQSVTDITVPTTVTKINDYALATWENLTSVKLHNGVTSIGNSAFYGYSKLTAITLPNSLKSIGKNAFECSGLTSVTIPDSVTEIGEWAFSNCDDLEYIKLPSGLKIIPEYMLIWCRNLRNITIPDSATTISKQAFYGAGIQWITIPASVTQIGDQAFYYADSLSHVFYTGTETQWKAIQKGTNLGLPTYPHHYCSADSALSSTETCSFDTVYCSHCQAAIGATSKQTATHNYISGVCSICGVDQKWTYTLAYGLAGAEAAIEITGYSGTDANLVIPEQFEGLPVTVIGDSAFKANRKIVSVTMPSTLQAIYGYAFYDCSSLKHIILPKSLTSVGDYAFYYCSNLSQVCFTGTSTQASSLTSGTGGNTYLKNATWTYNAVDPTVQVNDSCVDTKYVCTCCNKTVLTQKKTTPTHDYADATCTTPKTCKVCSATEGQALGHSGDVWFEIVAPTCTESGINARICSVCNETETVTVEPLGHSYDSVVTAPTCTEQGYTTNTCSVCGDVTVTDYVDAKGHSFGDWVQTSAPGCDQNGEEERTCACGERETQPIAALGHSYDSVVTAPTCTEQGYTTNTCGVCGDVTVTDYVDAKGHSWSAWIQTVAPTCTVEGSQVRFCNCGVRETGTVAKSAHTCENGICTVCGQLESYYWVLSADAKVDLTLAQDLYVDLNGYDLSGTINTNGYQIYGMDSTTNTYSCENVGYFNCVDENGNGIIPVRQFKTDTDMTAEIRRYMAIETESGFTFHRFYLGITSTSLNTATTGVGYKAVFYGDDMVKGQLDSFGFTMQLEGGNAISRYKTAEEFVPGKTVTLRINNYDAANYGETALYASVCMQLSDGTLIQSAEHSVTLRGMIESVNSNYTSYSADQLEAVKTMIENNPAMQAWDVGNIYKEENV